jgi:hypothetical protein
MRSTNRFRGSHLQPFFSNALAMNQITVHAKIVVIATSKVIISDFSSNVGKGVELQQQPALPASSLSLPLTTPGWSSPILWLDSLSWLGLHFLIPSLSPMDQ